MVTNSDHIVYNDNDNAVVATTKKIKNKKRKIFPLFCSNGNEVKADPIGNLELTLGGSNHTASSETSSITYSTACSGMSIDTLGSQKSKRNQDPPPKAVWFVGSTSITRTLARQDYTEIEKKKCWFQDDEYDRITKECANQVRKLESGKVLKDKKYCSRGLETHTKNASIAKMMNRRAAFDAVLDEQEKQFGTSAFNDEAIAERYKDVSSSCLLWARRVGLKDQLDAED